MTSITIPGGLLVAIEGIDGAGKSTLAKGLADLLVEAGFAVSTSKEPTAGRWGMKLRESAQNGRLSPGEEVDYLLRDRREHVDLVINPGLERGEVVILDRYFPSMVAYQGAAGIPVDDLLNANDFAPRPHLLLLLDLSPEMGLQRIASRGDKPNHFESADNLEKCRAIFLAMATGAQHVVDASRSESDVFLDAVALLSGAIASRLSVTSPGAPDNIDKVNALVMAHSG